MTLKIFDFKFLLTLIDWCCFKVPLSCISAISGLPCHIILKWAIPVETLGGVGINGIWNIGMSGIRTHTLQFLFYLLASGLNRSATPPPCSLLKKIYHQSHNLFGNHQYFFLLVSYLSIHTTNFISTKASKDALLFNANK